VVGHTATALGAQQQFVRVVGHTAIALGLQQFVRVVGHTATALGAQQQFVRVVGHTAIVLASQQKFTNDRTNVRCMKFIKFPSSPSD
jgi:hypothetical protein